MPKQALYLITAIAAVAAISLEPAVAGPGGFIAKAAFESFWGKLALAALTLVFLPLIVWVFLKEKRAEKRARRDLRFMAAHATAFDWILIKERVTDCFHRVHGAWRHEDVAAAAEWMTDWYWQNQQLVYLDRWRDEGLVNICNVKRVSDIKPVLFAHRNHPNEHEDSSLVVSVTAKMQDYLQQRDTQKLVEGSKRYKDVETVWTFRLQQGEWKVANIEESHMSITYAGMIRDLPAIESTVVSDLRA
jgi:hypothetical protein